LALTAAVSALPAASARTDLNDKKPITYTVDGATATGYFKVVTEAINGVVRDAYPEWPQFHAAVGTSRLCADGAEHVPASA